MVARPLKQGVDYFPKDTDFYGDYKVRLLRSEFGAKGMYLLDFLLCELYGKYGYFLPWDRNVQLLVADAVGCGCEPQYISEFIAGATRCSFFDERVRGVFGILTSAGIQRRYIRMCNSREKILIFKEYWLLDEGNLDDVPAGTLDKITFKNVSSIGNPVKSTDILVNGTGNPLNNNKVNNIILNKNKEYEKPPQALIDFHYKKIKKHFIGDGEIPKEAHTRYMTLAECRATLDPDYDYGDGDRYAE